jgi:hypothetical protein
MVGSCWADLPCAETCFTGRVFVSAMTPIIFIAIGFLGCWFLLYALMVWTQGPQRRFSATCEQTGESITGATGPARA